MEIIFHLIQYGLHIMLKDKNQVQRWMCSVITVLKSKKIEAFPRMKPGSISYHRMSPGFLFSFAFFFRATPMAYGNSQARVQIATIVATLCHSHNNARSKSVTYTTAYGNTGSLTH